MLNLHRFESLWRWFELCDGAAIPNRHSVTRLPAAPVRAARRSPTCACGRYDLVQVCALRWSVNPATGACEAIGATEGFGRVTSAELERWERGVQMRCSDDTCPAFAQIGMRAPSVSPHTDPECPVHEIIG